MNDTDIAKLKVAELRAELLARGLDSKGNKPVLIDRLKIAIDAEASDSPAKEGGSTEEKGAEKKEQNDNEIENEEELLEGSTEEQNGEQEETPAEDDPADEETPANKDDAEDAPQEDNSDDKVEDEDCSAKASAEDVKMEAEENENDKTSEAVKDKTSKAVNDKTSEAVKDKTSEAVKGKTSETVKDKTSEAVKDKTSEAVKDKNSETVKDKTSEAIKDKNSETVKDKTSEAVKDKTSEAVKDKTSEAVKDKTSEAVKEEAEVKNEADAGNDNREEQPMEADVKEEEKDEDESRGVKRAGSPSADGEGDDDPAAKKARPDVELVDRVYEDEPEFDPLQVALDWYNSDLSLKINRETNRLSATPLTNGGFGLMWHGVRATYGANKGKVCYEVRIEKNMTIDVEDEVHPHVLRCGWSVDSSTLSLGEDKLSYGYGGTAKASVDLKFKDYGKTFKEGDVVGCFLDFENDPVVMSFSVNGEAQGVCFEVPKEELGEQALFPHILTKNCRFKVNFGSEEKAWCEPEEGFTFLSTVPIDDLQRGTKGAEKREDCEAIMMVGLPASGKTTWAEKYCEEHPELKINVLGTNTLIDKMKVNGLPRKRNYSGRWEVLIDKCTKVLNRLLTFAVKRRRNFIIDQTNVYPSAQKRKVKGFVRFKRRAVVICPDDEELKSRNKKRESEEGKDVPDKAVLEMKANFKLPEVGEFFDEVEFVELGREEAEKLIEQYNKDGEKEGFGPRQKFGRGSHSSNTVGRRGSGNFIDRRGGGYNRGGGSSSSYRGGGWDRDRDRRGSFDRRDRNSGGWNRDSRDFRDNRNYNRDNRSSGNWNRDRNSRGGGSGNWQGGGGGNGGSSWQGSGYNKGANQNNLKQTGNWSSNQSSSGQQQSSWGGANQGYGGQSTWGQVGGYGGGSGSGYNWNQQYYGQQQQPQQQQSYWQGYGQQQQAGYGQQNYYGQQQQQQGQQGQQSQQATQPASQPTNQWASGNYSSYSADQSGASGNNNYRK